MEIDPDTLRCSITADPEFFTTPVDAVPVWPSTLMQVYFNHSMKALLPSFPYKFNDSTGDGPPPPGWAQDRVSQHAPERVPV